MYQVAYWIQYFYLFLYLQISFICEIESICCLLGATLAENLELVIHLGFYTLCHNIF